MRPKQNEKVVFVMNTTKTVKNSISYFCFMCLCLLAGIKANAQSPTQRYDDVQPRAIDYMTSGDYMLLGQINPATVAGYPNDNTLGGYNARVQLQIVEPATLSTLSVHTYVMKDETDGVDLNVCPDLSVAFYPEDAKETSTGDFVICGKVVSDLETGNCNTIAFNDPFIMKVNSAGAVIWFRYYRATDPSSSPVNMDFRSIVEDPATGNIIVCGTANYGGGLAAKGLAVGCQPNGAVSWHHEVDVPHITDPTRSTVTAYNEITPYNDAAGGGQTYVIVGTTTSYQPAYGGVIITNVDAMGNNPAAPNSQSQVITSGLYQHTLTGEGVEDSHDGTVLITGPVMEWAIDRWHPHVMKVDPYNYAVTFLNKYPVSNRNVFSYSIDDWGSGATDDPVYVTGDDRQNPGTSLINRGAFYLELDYYGNFVRYDVNNYTNAQLGIGIIKDDFGGYPVYSCVNDLDNTALITDKHMGNSCANSETITPAQINYSYQASNLSSPLIFTNPTKTVLDDMPPVIEGKICGNYKPGKTTSVETLASENGVLVVTPNPAQEIISVQLPENMANGTVNVIDITGRVVLTQPANVGKDNIDVNISSLMPGNYIISIADADSNYKAHFVKN